MTPEVLAPILLDPDGRNPSLLQTALDRRFDRSHEVIPSDEQGEADAIFVTLHQDVERFLRATGQQARESLGLQMLEPGEEAQVGELVPDHFGRGFSFPFNDIDGAVNVELFLTPYPDGDNLKITIKVVEIAEEKGYLELDGLTGTILKPSLGRWGQSTPIELRKGNLNDARKYRELFDFLLTPPALAAPHPF